MKPVFLSEVPVAQLEPDILFRLMTNDEAVLESRTHKTGAWNHTANLTFKDKFFALSAQAIERLQKGESSFKINPCNYQSHHLGEHSTWYVDARDVILIKDNEIVNQRPIHQLWKITTDKLTHKIESLEPLLTSSDLDQIKVAADHMKNTDTETYKLVSYTLPIKHRRFKKI